MPPIVGVVGKTNVGKSTFFAAATLVTPQIANHPFTTIEPNVGVGYLRVECICKKLKVSDNPVNSTCIEGNRFIPVKLVDVAGLIPGAHKGRGLGNKFLDHIRRADALIHVVDASGSTDEQGRPVPPGTHDPVEDVVSIEREIDEWFYQILSKDWKKFARYVDYEAEDVVKAFAERLSGLSIDKKHVIEALRRTKLENTKLTSWREEELKSFISELRRTSKPIVVAANKSDLSEAEENIKRMRELIDHKVIPTSAVSELALRKAAEKNLIKYLPGDSSFKILDSTRLTREQEKALEYIKVKVLEKWGYTGVQQVLNYAFFNLLKMIVVYPVEDQNKLTDSKGNVLPDAILVREGATARELAYKIHSEIGKGFLYAINVLTKQKVGEDYRLKSGDVIKIVVARA